MLCVAASPFFLNAQPAAQYQRERPTRALQRSCREDRRAQHPATRPLSPARMIAARSATPPSPAKPPAAKLARHGLSTRGLDARVQAMVQAALPGLFPDMALFPAQRASGAALPASGRSASGPSRSPSAAPLAAPSSGSVAVAVVAPGAGTRANGAVYARLGHVPDIKVELVGQSGAPYDCYPETWRQGKRGQNLRSFADELLQRGVVDSKDCLILGSRGGQVVLPHLWHCRGNAVPPAVVINGGCAMKLPTPTVWPQAAVTFLLLGGKDHFNQGLSEQEYLAQTKSCVPSGNRTTAILYVGEMEHMPQSQLLESILQPMMRAAMAWKKSGAATAQDLDRVRKGLQQGSWSGRLLLTTGPGVWHDEAFGARRSPAGIQQVAYATRLGGA